MRYYNKIRGYAQVHYTANNKYYRHILITMHQHVTLYSISFNHKTNSFEWLSWGENFLKWSLILRKEFNEVLRECKSFH